MIFNGMFFSYKKYHGTYNYSAQRRKYASRITPTFYGETACISIDNFIHKQHA